MRKIGIPARSIRYKLQWMFIPVGRKVIGNFIWLQLVAEYVSITEVEDDPSPSQQSLPSASIKLNNGKKIYKFSQGKYLNSNRGNFWWVMGAVATWFSVWALDKWSPS